MMPSMTRPPPYGSPSWTRSKLAASMTPHAIALASALQRVDSVPTKKNGTAPRQVADAMRIVSTNTAPAETSLWCAAACLLCKSCWAVRLTALLSCSNCLLWLLVAACQEASPALCVCLPVPRSNAALPSFACAWPCKWSQIHKQRISSVQGQQSSRVVSGKEA